MILKLGLVVGLLAACVSHAKESTMTLAPEARVKSGTSRDLTFDLAAIPAGQQVRLATDMRVDSTGLDGFTPFMKMFVNKRSLLGPDLVNKPVDFVTRNGVDYAWMINGEWTVLYSPDFSDKVQTSIIPWSFPDTDPYHFVWDITPYVKPGKNTITIEHLPVLAHGSILVLRDLAVEIGDPIKAQGVPPVAPAPTGSLATYVTRGSQKVPMEVSVSTGGSIRLKVSGKVFEVSSRTSEPNGRWVCTTCPDWQPVRRGAAGLAKWECRGYSVERRVSVEGDHVRVADTLTNRTDAVIGVIYENYLDSGQVKPEKILLCGRPICSPEGAEDPAHPSAIAVWPDFAVGMFAEDDIFRIHIRANTDGKSLSLSDPQLGVPPGKAYTLEWTIYPAPKGDYWDVINAVRRNWGSNYTIPGPGLFDGGTDGTRPQEFFDRTVKTRGLKLAFSGQTDFKGDEMPKYPTYTVDLAEGTAIPMGKRWCASAAEWVKKWHAADPAVRTFIYMHPSICTEPGAETKYADCKIMDAKGNHITSPYRYPVYEYIATLDNAYGKAYLETLKTILKEINPDGIFMDEFSGGSVPVYVYGAAWDNCTVEIDRTTHAITGRRSSLQLLDQGWKKAVIEHLRRNGKILVGNGAPHTRTIQRLQVLNLHELGSYSWIVFHHLTTPWGLGNHDNAQDESVRATMTRRTLDYAGVICGYGWGDDPKGLHFWRTMFPITPVELRAGMILGKERIVTNRSGRYGWPDGSDAVVYVFDGKGALVEKPDVKRVKEGGRTWLEIRMPGDHFASLVRKAR